MLIARLSDIEHGHRKSRIVDAGQGFEHTRRSNILNRQVVGDVPSGRVGKAIEIILADALGRPAKHRSDAKSLLLSEKLWKCREEGKRWLSPCRLGREQLKEGLGSGSRI